MAGVFISNNTALGEVEPTPRKENCEVHGHSGRMALFISSGDGGRSRGWNE